MFHITGWSWVALTAVSSRLTVDEIIDMTLSHYKELFTSYKLYVPCIFRFRNYALTVDYWHVDRWILTHLLATIDTLTIDYSHVDHWLFTRWPLTIDTLTVDYWHVDRWLLTRWQLTIDTLTVDYWPVDRRLLTRWPLTIDTLTVDRQFSYLTTWKMHCRSTGGTSRTRGISSRASWETRCWGSPVMQEWVTTQQSVTLCFHDDSVHHWPGILAFKTTMQFYVRLFDPFLWIDH